LVFTDNFDGNWEALVGASLLPHFRVNSFENGFYVDKKGQFDLRILFAGQEIRTSLVIVSFIGTGLIVIVNLIPPSLSTRLRRRTKKEPLTRPETALKNNGIR
jgi:hypothetical protein